MNITNDQPGTDFVAYFTTQLPKDLAAMATLRDELARRQGALTAVDDANRLREEAKKVLESAQAEAKKQLDAAKEQGKLANDRHVELNKREADLKEKLAAFEAESSKRAGQLDARAKDIQRQEKALQDRETKLLATADEVAKDKAKLVSDRDQLEQRIKAFQAKVAALTA